MCSITALSHSIVSTANSENTQGTRLPWDMLSKWQRLWKRKRRRQKSLWFAVGFPIALKDSRCDSTDWRSPNSQQHHWQSSALGSNDPPNGTAFYPSSNGGGASSKGVRRIGASGWWARKRGWEVRMKEAIEFYTCTFIMNRNKGWEEGKTMDVFVVNGCEERVVVSIANKPHNIPLLLNTLPCEDTYFESPHHASFATTRLFREPTMTP